MGYKRDHERTVPAPRPPVTSEVYDLTDSEEMVEELRERTPTQHRTRSRVLTPSIPAYERLPAPTPQLTPVQQTNILAELKKAVEYMIDNKVKTRVKTEVAQAIKAPQLQLTKLAEAVKKLTEEVKTLSKVATTLDNRIVQCEKSCRAMQEVCVPGHNVFYY